MPAKKKTMKKKTYKRKSYIPRAMVPRADYNCILRVDSVPEITNSDLYDDVGAYAFKLTDCIDYLTYAKLWDQYRINKVVVKFVPTGATNLNKPYDATTAPNAIQQIPLFATCLDFDDATSPTNYNDVKKRQGSREVPAIQKVTWAFKPSKLISVYQSSTSTGYIANFNRDWLDTNTGSGIPHYGLKWSIKIGSPAGVFRYRVNVSMYLSFRSRVL